MRQRLPLVILTAVLAIGIFTGLILSSKLDLTGFTRADDKPDVNFASAATDLVQIESSGKAFAQIANQVKPVVVTIISEKKFPWAAVSTRYSGNSIRTFLNKDWGPA